MLRIKSIDPAQSEQGSSRLALSHLVLVLAFFETALLAMTESDDFIEYVLLLL